MTGTTDGGVIGDAAFAAGAVALLLTGCTLQAPPGPQALPQERIDCRSEPGSMPPGSEMTAPNPPIPVPGRVPAGFEASAALRCALEFADIGDEGDARDAMEISWRVERFEGDLAPLLAALAAPDDVPPPDQACTADMELVPALWLEGRDGVVVPVRYPRDGCGKTKPGVRNALDALEVTSVERREWSAGADVD